MIGGPDGPAQRRSGLFQRLTGEAVLVSAAKSLALGGIVVRKGSLIAAAAAAERSTPADADAVPLAGSTAVVIGTIAGMAMAIGAAVGAAIIAIECIEDDVVDFFSGVESFSTMENFRIISLSSWDMMWQCQM